MNRENILKVADAIEQNSIPGLGFYMRDVFDTEDDCGAVACIAGWAWHVERNMERPMTRPEVKGLSPDNSAAFLGIFGDTASFLFYGGGTDLSFSELTSPVAVQCLRNLATTGKVDWDRAYYMVTP